MTDLKTLAEIYEDFKGPACYGDKGTVHSYIEVYEQLLAPFRETAQHVLEIGALAGHSIRMWEHYFVRAAVHGVDISTRPVGGRFDLEPMIAEGTHHIHIFDATVAEQVEAHFQGIMFEVIIDDASHVFEHQMAMYANLRTHLSPGGIYIIEDIEDIDRRRAAFEQIDASKSVKIMDRRGIKGRFDDVLVVIS